MTVTLYTGALTTREAALSALGRKQGSTEEDLVLSAVNYASAEMERVTGRRLAARAYAKVVSPASDTRLVLDGDGDHYLRLSEYPVNTLTSAAWLDEDGTETAIDLTGARLLHDPGRAFVPWEAVPQGTGNILVTCNCGYAIGTPERYDLERLCLRLTAIIFQDIAKEVGRVTDATLLNASSRIPGFELPADIADGLKAYRRLW